jgi:hypothetical protein
MITSLRRNMNPMMKKDFSEVMRELRKFLIAWRLVSPCVRRSWARCSAGQLGASSRERDIIRSLPALVCISERVHASDTSSGACQLSSATRSEFTRATHPQELASSRLQLGASSRERHIIRSLPETWLLTGLFANELQHSNIMPFSPLLKRHFQVAGMRDAMG